jgi:hypothetical protein
MLVDRQDVLFALRSARRTPLLTAVVVLALSVGIGLNAGVFSILNVLVLQPPTRKDPATFAQIFPQYQGWFSNAGEFTTFNVDDFNAIRAQSHSFSAVSAWSRLPTYLDDVHQQGESLLVTADYFQVYGIHPPLMGRYFLPEELAPDSSARVAVLSEHQWKNLYAADPHILGRLYVRFSGDPKPVAAAIADALRTLDPTQAQPPSTIWDFLETGATEITSLAHIIIFMAGIAVLLAITGVHGVLSFAIRRRTREFGIRMTLGATRPLIFSAVLTRGLRQIALGLVCGAVLCIPSAWTFMRITERSWLRVDTFDASVYGIAAVILLLVSLSAMFLPAFRATQVDPMQALRTE